MIINKEDFFEQLNFVGGMRKFHRAPNDISIMYNKATAGVPCYNFTFRNNTQDKFGEGPKIMIARYKNRIIFKRGDEGIALTTSGAQTSKYAKFRLRKETEYLKNFVGDYNLKYDDLYEYYYIEKEDLK